MTNEILEHPFIATPRDSFHWEDRYRLREAGGAYPAFASISAPFTPSVAMVSWDTEHDIAQVIKSKTEKKEYSSIRSAYLDNYNGVDSFVHMDYGTLKSSSEITLLDGKFVFASDNSPLNLYQEHDDEILVSRYVEWLRGASRWAKNPSDFYNAHYFIRSHPAAWIVREDMPHQWKTSYGLPEVSVHIAKGLPLIMLEGVVRSPRGDSHHAHDEDISAYCPTYEEAILSYARNLHTKYDLQGVKR